MRGFNFVLGSVSFDRHPIHNIMNTFLPFSVQDLIHSSFPPSLLNTISRYEKDDNSLGEGGGRVSVCFHWYIQTPICCAILHFTAFIVHLIMLVGNGSHKSYVPAGIERIKVRK